ncbi:MAG: extracellular solute-binding protein [Clostridia bacterium]|nr:extracellular solute-binding protein [Clostridia bacterium]
MTKLFKQSTSFLLMLFMLVGMVFLPVGAAFNVSAEEAKETDSNVLVIQSDYDLYKSASGLSAAKEDVKFDLSAFTVAKGNPSVKYEDYAGKNALVWLSDKDAINIPVMVANAGLYEIQVTYFVIDESGANVDFSLKIDGVSPFPVAEKLDFTCMWKDADGKNKDDVGNEYAPEQVQVREYNTTVLYDPAGGISEDLQFAFTAGQHTITIEKDQGYIAIAEISLVAPKEIKSYSDVKKDYKAAGYKNYDGKVITIEAEDAIKKSVKSLVPKCDNSSANIRPREVSKSVMNYIGASNWKTPREEIQWEFNVEKAGLYRIGFNYKQDQIIDGISYRWLKVDGKTPFEEAKNVKFEYNTDWAFTVLDNGEEDCLIYLDEGKHTISLAGTMGETDFAYDILEGMVEKIGNFYLDIVTITGSSPDKNRDYDLHKQIPNFVENLESYRDTLNDLAAGMKALSGKRSSQYIAAINDMSRILNSMCEDSYKAHIYVADYFTKYTTLGTWLSEMKSMPLSLDCIQLTGADVEFDSREAGFFEGLAFGTKRLLVSFGDEYSRISHVSGEGETIKIWVNWGRDQATVLNSLIQESFTPQTGINVNLELTNASIINGMLAGIAPDLSLHMARTEPVNLAMRGALYDLKNFDDYEEIMKRFGDSAGMPYQYKNGAYALPDTQAFYIMYYREDILADFGLKVPETWEDFIDVTTSLQHNNLQVGLPYTQISAATTVNTGVGGLNLFAGILQQHGGSLYDEKQTQAMLTSPTSFKAFTFWTDLYTKYRIPTVQSFYNRFRAGTTPLGIEPYNIYTTISDAAPEIDGKWSIALVPGVKDENGKVNHTVSGSGTGCGILKHSENKEAAWEFLKWWTSADIQLRYNNNIESILGAISRVTTANVEAFSRMSWDKEHLATLLEQRTWIKEVPEVPGSYYLSRSVDQAFWDVYNNDANPKDTLTKWDKIADSEIQRKIAQYAD